MAGLAQGWQAFGSLRRRKLIVFVLVVVVILTEHLLHSSENLIAVDGQIRAAYSIVESVSSQHGLSSIKILAALNCYHRCQKSFGKKLYQISDFYARELHDGLPRSEEPL
jgi:hypothetical protein